MIELLRCVPILVAVLMFSACGSSDSVDDGGSTTPATNAVSGKITFDRVPFNVSLGAGLDFNGIINSPVRGVTVQIVDAADRVTVLGSDLTDANGDYSIPVQPDQDVFVRARAEMLKTGAPSWNFTVVDNTQGNALYTLDSRDSNTSGANVMNLRADSGWGGTSYTSARAAAPFSILDGVYQALQLMLSVDADVQFPPLRLYWSPFNAPTIPVNLDAGAIGTSHFSSFGANPGIYLLGLEDSDTDEFDQHVVIHEWGHYFEDALSRSDSIGGSHGPGDQLDLRVAFGEGWGNALSGMAKGDPVYRDSFGNRQGQDFGFNLEGQAGPNPGWYSEESIQEILYDLFDADADGVDNLALGFAPIYDVMVGRQRTTTSLTSIFSFISALKDANPTAVAGIDTIVADQSIDTIVDVYGSNETNAGNPTSDDVLPIYNSVTVGGPAVNVCSDVNYGPSNKLGVRAFVRFTTLVSASHGIMATATLIPPGVANADPDLALHDRGEVQIADSEVLNTETLTSTLTAGQEYVVEIIEFANITTSPIGRTCFDVTVVEQ